MRSLGLRRTNVTGLQWSQVDMVRRMASIHPEQAKAPKAIAVPLNADAVTVIRRWLGGIRRTCSAFEAGRYARSVRRRVRSPRTGRNPRLRWHDLRHTWASWHVQNGTPLFALQELGG